jgi:hypothetical protein
MLIGAYRLHKKRVGTRYTELVFLHPVGSMCHIVNSGASGRKMSLHYFSCSGGTDTDLKKACRDTLRQTCVFASGGICGSRSAFRCIEGAKRRHTIFQARVGRVWIPQK